uniref:Uncharacterized protein n=1 Tax=Caenorhabditis japonica TaxID=281687 RepID=A0A8R1I8N0_CAEJA
MANQMASSQIFPVKATETRVLHATVLSSEGPPPNPSVSDKNKKKYEDMRRIIENPRKEEEEEEEGRNMKEKSDYEKKKQEKSAPAKRSQSIDNEQQAENQPDADGVNEGQPPGILVITQRSTADIQTTANSRSRSAHSTSPSRRITRSMSASQQPRVNVFSMKPVATIPILSGTNKENFQENELKKQNSQAILRTKPPVYPMDTAEREHFCEDFSNKNMCSQQPCGLVTTAAADYGTACAVAKTKTTVASSLRISSCSRRILCNIDRTYAQFFARRKRTINEQHMSRTPKRTKRGKTTGFIRADDGRTVYTPPTIVGPPPNDFSSDDLEIDVPDQKNYVEPQKFESEFEPESDPEYTNPRDNDYPVPAV